MNSRFLPLHFNFFELPVKILLEDCIIYDSLFLLLLFLLSPGTKAYDKLHKLLTNTRMVNDVKKMSPDAQTSCLEGFHSTLNHWHPKMVCFSWLGTYCR